MNIVKEFLEKINLKTKLHDEEFFIKNEDFFRKRIIDDFEKLSLLEDKYKDKPAIIMGLGPSLLELDKQFYSSYLKITCNDFHKIPNFYDNSFLPDFWCGANSIDILKEPLKVCVEKDITSIISIPKKTELEILLNNYPNQKVISWLWECRELQILLAAKYKMTEIYSHCNTITNHMLALALFMGCNPIHITGFDLSYSKALKETGTTHAGYSHESILSDSGKLGLKAFDDPKEKKQVIDDLRYLCKIAYNNKIKITNLSYKKNNLPYNLSYEK